MNIVNMSNQDEKLKLKNGMKKRHLDIPRDMPRTNSNLPTTTKQALNAIYDEGVMDKTMGNLIYVIHKDEFMYDSAHSIWFHLDEYGIWHPQNKELPAARELLAGKIHRRIVKDHTRRLTKDSKNKTIPKTFSSIQNYLGTSKKMGEMIAYMKIVFDYPKVFEKMDSQNHYLFAFTNGVYDLKSKFRNARPSEYISTTCGYDYSLPVKEDIDAVYRIWASIFPVKSERKYTLEIFAMRLSSEVKRQEFYMMLGPGGNGKGIISTLLRSALGVGNYYGTMSRESFLDSKYESAGRASPELAKNKSSRAVIVSELQDGDKLKTGVLKQMTGGDMVDCRMLYGNTFSFLPGFTLFFFTNFAPVIDGADGGIARRFRYIPFRQVFKTEDQNPDYEKGEKLADLDLTENVSSVLMASHYSIF